MVDAYKNKSVQQILIIKRMFDKRIKIFVIISAAFLLVCLIRLGSMQLLSDSYYLEKIAALKNQRNRSKQLKTVRGKILDRNNKVLAVDEPRFYLNINYELCSVLDERVRQGTRLNTKKQSLIKIEEKIESKLNKLQQVIEKCTYFGIDISDVEKKIEKINNRIWNMRVFQAWRQNCMESSLYKKYKNNLFKVRRSQYIADFEEQVSDPNDRLKHIIRTNIAEMYKNWSLLELKTDDDIFTAQLEFSDIDDVGISPKAHRVYNYGSVAAQTIGWVGPAHDRKTFSDDETLRCIDDEVCGREDGVEYVLEKKLRGRRGKIVYDIDRRVRDKIPTEFGEDVSLTLDIELQREIEEYLSNCDLNGNCKKPTAVAIIDVGTGQILALVSKPSFDLNLIRQDYTFFVNDPNQPLRNRAIHEQYPPGSIMKPFVLIAGLEAGEISREEIISCPAKKTPKGWPRCWIQRKFSWKGHDDSGPNNAHNAIKGSCNIYFSRLAGRIVPSVLQKFLFDFGYGRKILDCSSIEQDGLNRNLRQYAGVISSSIPQKAILNFEDLPALRKNERRYFGIGQGNLRVTPLQVANAMATLARGGLYRSPQLFMDNSEKPVSNTTFLNIDPETLRVVTEDMAAVVNDIGGTAYKAFAPANFTEQDVNIYGKTGSTQAPEVAWFAGFAEDKKDRSISLAIVVEGGQHGSSDAAPLARDIIQFCIDRGYVGQVTDTK